MGAPPDIHPVTDAMPPLPSRAPWVFVIVMALVLDAGCRAPLPPAGITVLLEAPPDSLDDRFAHTAH